MANIVTDPFTAVYNELWAILLDSENFNVKRGNLINYIGKRDPEKDEVATEDLPEVRLSPNGIIPHIQNTSSSSRLTVRYSIEVRSGDKRLDESHYPLIWAVYKAMRPWATRLRALTCAENDNGTFVITGRPVDTIQEGMERGEVSRGIAGWFAIWSIEVDMWFKSSALS